MAFFNEIGAGRYNRFIQKLFNMKGGPPARQLASDVAMVFPFFNGNELRFLESWNLYGKNAGPAAVAAQFGFVQLRNPPGSNVIAVVHKITMSESAIDSIAVSITNAAVADATVSNVFGIDSRNTASSSLIFSFGTQAANPSFGNGILWAQNVGANAALDYVQDQVQELPVLPGLTLRVSANTVNQALLVSFGWRERAIEDSEKLTS